MPRPGTLEVCRKYLFEDIDSIPEPFRERVTRVRVGFTHWYEFPTKTRTEVRDLITKEFGVVKKTAYEDIQVIEILLGNIKSPAKDWMRYKVNSMLEAAYKIAEEQADPKAMAMVADKIGKYNQLDKQDKDKLPYEDIVPQSFEPTDDPTPLGLKKDPEIREKKRKMLEKYISEIEIIDVPYEDISANDPTESPDEENLL